jgi:parvulin-like peptidyl-prolyl isomerase
MLTQGVSSRQLAPIYGAGESRNRAIGAASEAAMAQNLAARGVGGGIQAGVEQANLAAQNARSADLNNAIVQQQLQQRPEMLNMAANLLANRDAQAAAELQAGQGMNLQASQMALNQMNLERQQRMQEEAIARANRQQEMESIGSVLALLEPELQRMRTRGKKTNQPIQTTNTPFTPENTPGYGLETTIEQAPDVSFNLPSPDVSAITPQDIVNAGRAQPANIGGGIQQVTDIATMQEIERSPSKRITKDVGNGLALVAYLDPRTGRYMKMYSRSNPEFVGEPISGQAVLREGEVPMTQRTFGKAFYG